jgi:hypothetical protein
MLTHTLMYMYMYVQINCTLVNNYNKLTVLVYAEALQFPLPLSQL